MIGNADRFVKEIDALTYNARSVLNALIRSSVESGSASGYSVYRSKRNSTQPEKITIEHWMIYSLERFFNNWEKQGFTEGAFDNLIIDDNQSKNSIILEDGTKSEPVTRGLVNLSKILFGNVDNLYNYSLGDGTPSYKSNLTPETANAIPTNEEYSELFDVSNVGYWLYLIRNSDNKKLISNASPISLDIRTPTFDSSLSTNRYSTNRAYLFPTAWYKLDMFGYIGDGASHQLAGTSWDMFVDKLSTGSVDSWAQGTNSFTANNAVAAGNNASAFNCSTQALENCSLSFGYETIAGNQSYDFINPFNVGATTCDPTACIEVATDSSTGKLVMQFTSSVSYEVNDIIRIFNAYDANGDRIRGSLDVTVFEGSKDAESGSGTWVKVTTPEGSPVIASGKCVKLRNTSLPVYSNFSCGQYNEPNANNLFAIGSGTSSESITRVSLRYNETTSDYDFLISDKYQFPGEKLERNLFKVTNDLITMQASHGPITTALYEMGMKYAFHDYNRSINGTGDWDEVNDAHPTLGTSIVTGEGALLGNFASTVHYVYAQSDSLNLVGGNTQLTVSASGTNRINMYTDGDISINSDYNVKLNPSNDLTINTGNSALITTVNAMNIQSYNSSIGIQANTNVSVVAPAINLNGSVVADTFNTNNDNTKVFAINPTNGRSHTKNNYSYHWVEDSGFYEISNRITGGSLYDLPNNEDADWMHLINVVHSNQSYNANGQVGFKWMLAKGFSSTNIYSGSWTSDGNSDPDPITGLPTDIGQFSGWNKIKFDEGEGDTYNLINRAYNFEGINDNGTFLYTRGTSTNKSINKSIIIANGSPVSAEQNANIVIDVDYNNHTVVQASGNISSETTLASFSSANRIIRENTGYNKIQYANFSKVGNTVYLDFQLVLKLDDNNNIDGTGYAEDAFVAYFFGDDIACLNNIDLKQTNMSLPNNDPFDGVGEPMQCILSPILDINGISKGIAITIFTYNGAEIDVAESDTLYRVAFQGIYRSSTFTPIIG